MMQQQLPAHEGDIVGAGDVALRCQAGAVDKMGVRHAQLGGSPVHLLHEQLVHTGDLFRQRHRRVVAGGHAHRFQQFLHRDLFTLRQIDLTAAHPGGRGADRHHVVVADRAAVDGLHGQQQRHDLGDAGGLQLLVLVLGEQHLPRGTLHQQRRPAGDGQLHRLRLRRVQPQRAQHRRQQTDRAPYLPHHKTPPDVFSYSYARGREIMRFDRNCGCKTCTDLL